MTRNQDLLDDEIGVAPPSTVDVDAIIVRQRRRVRYQRAGLAATTGAMAVAIALVISMVPRGGASNHVTAVKVSTPDVITPAAQPSPKTDPRDQEAARLTAALKQIMAAALPHAQFLADPDFPGTDPLVFTDEGSFFQASAAIKDASGTGEIRVSTGKEVPATPATLACYNDQLPLDVSHWSCDVRPGPDGAAMMVVSNHIGTLKFQQNFTQFVRTDNNSVWVSATNGRIFPNYVGHRPTPPLTKSEVTTIAGNPALALTLH